VVVPGVTRRVNRHHLPEKDWGKMPAFKPVEAPNLPFLDKENYIPDYRKSQLNFRDKGRQLTKIH
jgi:hypothetical protein